MAETVTSQGKSTGETAAPSASLADNNGFRLALSSFAIAAAVLGAQGFQSVAYAQSAQSAPSVLPTGGVVTSGTGSISTAGNTLTVNQSSNVLGANWQSFSIGAGNTVIFNQPSSTAIAVNRVVGNSQSQIFGNLQANGQVFLINPNGVMFGRGAQVQVGALVATTKNITDSQIAAGNYTFTGASTAGIVSQGNITATGTNGAGGYVVLHADSISNDGTITANGGTISLSAGQTLGFALNNGQLVSVQASGDVLNALVQNKGLIVADGGSVYLTARGKDTLLNTVVNNEGIIQARSMSSKNGIIILDGGSAGVGGDVLNSGTLDVSGAGANKGGAVIVTGDRIGILNGSTINASGDAGGGRVIIGGDNLQKAVDVMNVGVANQTVVQAGSVINISSKNGDGGFLETSGHVVNINGQINGAAPNGKAGQWLIDPNDIVINSSANTSFTNTSGIWSGDDTVTTSVVNNLALGNALTNNTAIEIRTNGSGNITVNNNVTAVGQGSLLTLNASAGNVNVNAAVNMGFGGGLSLRGQNISSNASGVITTGSERAYVGLAVLFTSIGGSGVLAGNITGTGGLNFNALGGAFPVTLTLTGNNTYTGATWINSKTATLQIGAGGGAGSISGGGNGINNNGNLIFNTSSNQTVERFIVGSGNLTQAGSGVTTLTANNTYTGTTTISNGTLQIGAGGTDGSIGGTSSIVNNANLIFNTSSVQTVGVVISGTGNLTDAGWGCITLTGNNTYNGTTTVSAGVLHIGAGGANGSIANTSSIVNNGGLVFNTSSNQTVAVAISGGGYLIQDGSGVTTLTGNNTYTSGTYIFNGALQIGAGGANGSIANTSNILNFGNLIFNTSSNQTVEQQTGSLGNLTQAGSGVTTLTGDISNEKIIISNGALQIGAGRAIACTTSIVNNANLIFNISGNRTVDTVISGTGNLTQAGGGVTTLNRTNTYNGTTTISSGTLQIGAGGANGSIASTTSIVNNGTLTFNTSSNQTVGLVISGTGKLTQAGSGVTTLTANNTYTGATTISNGTLQLGVGGASGSIANTSSIVNNADLIFKTSDCKTVSTAISGTGNLTIIGGCTTLTADNNYTGITTLSNTTLVAGQDGFGSIANTSSIVVNDSFLILGRGNTNPSFREVRGVISGNDYGWVTISGRGTDIPVWFKNANTFTGRLTITPYSRLVIGEGGSIANTPSISLFDGSQLSFESSSNQTVGGVISGTGSVWQYGSGVTTLTGNNTYNGSIFIGCGTLQIGAGGANGSIANSSSIVNNANLVFNTTSNQTVGAAIRGTGNLSIVQGNVTGDTANFLNLTGNANIAANATLDLAGYAASVGGLTGGGNVTSASAATLTVGSGNASSQFDGLLQNALALTKEGAGKLILNGTNTYTGATTISNGTLQIGAGGANGSIANTTSIVNNANLIFNTSSGQTVGALISGTGNLTQA
ncbi:MAG: autotransporter-associated beta strand repeat-containing protein, partial [Cytophagales bacterium]|nr:autotransporter-associated beta strand repeat-containing protein [Cytophagales bacterium]